MFRAQVLQSVLEAIPHWAGGTGMVLQGHGQGEKEWPHLPCDAQHLGVRLAYCVVALPWHPPFLDSSLRKGESNPAGHFAWGKGPQEARLHPMGR